MTAVVETGRWTGHQRGDVDEANAGGGGDFCTATLSFELARKDGP